MSVPKARTLLLIVALITWAGVTALIPAASLVAQAPSQAGLQDRCVPPGIGRAAFNRQNGAVRFVGTEPGRPIRQPGRVEPASNPEAAARAYLSVCGSLFGLPDR